MDERPMATALRNKAAEVRNLNVVSEKEYQTLRDAADLLRAMAHLMEGMPTITAFGSPGDWGYETELGKAVVALRQGTCAGAADVTQNASFSRGPSGPSAEAIVRTATVNGEKERLKHNLAVTEQTMREYQELAAKRLEEIDRLKDERESHGPEGRNYTNLQVVEMRQKFTERINEQKAELAKYRDAPVVAYQHRDGMLSCRLPGGGVPGIDWASLIVKPGEDK